MYVCWLRTWADKCLGTSCGRSWRLGMYPRSLAAPAGRSDQEASKACPLTPHFIVSVARGPGVVKFRSLTELRGIRVSVETYVDPKGPLQCKRCQRFGHTQRYCGYAPRCVALRYSTPHSGECCTSKQQIQCCSCGGNNTVNCRGCVKWKEVKAALLKQTPI